MGINVLAFRTPFAYFVFPDVFLLYWGQNIVLLSKASSNMTFISVKINLGISLYFEKFMRNFALGHFVRHLGNQN